MKSILGIDVGFRNLSHCIVSVPDGPIANSSFESSPLPSHKSIGSPFTIMQWASSDITGAVHHICSKCTSAAQCTLPSGTYSCYKHIPSDVPRFPKCTTRRRGKDLKAFLKEHAMDKHCKSRTIHDMEAHIRSFAAYPIFKKRFHPTEAQLVEAISTWIVANWPHMETANEVIIENQPAMFHNPVKTVQRCIVSLLQAKFLSHGLSPSIRLVNGRPREGRSYYQHKKDAVTLACSIVATSKWERWFSLFPKKDDLADSLLLAMLGARGGGWGEFLTLLK